jgi:hypothetical protein
MKVEVLGNPRTRLARLLAPFALLVGAAGNGCTHGVSASSLPEASADGEASTKEACPGLGCLPACPNGLAKDENGCDTCQCAPAAEGGSGAGTD